MSKYYMADDIDRALDELIREPDYKHSNEEWFDGVFYARDRIERLIPIEISEDALKDAYCQGWNTALQKARELVESGYLALTLKGMEVVGIKRKENNIMKFRYLLSLIDDDTCITITDADENNRVEVDKDNTFLELFKDCDVLNMYAPDLHIFIKMGSDNE